MSKKRRAKARRARALPAALPATAAERPKGSVGRGWLAVGAFAVLVTAIGAYLLHTSGTLVGPEPSRTPPERTAPVASTAHFSGAASCASCHSKEFAAWQGSQHAKAMQHASDGTVLGDFHGRHFTYNRVTSTFFRRDGKFLVNTDGPDGKLADYEILYTFGLYPLQQYLIAFPGGRLQALSIAWDARPQDQGGQRWYHLYPDEKITSKDPLHWTRDSQNWNWMCANCHTTKLDRHYDAATNTYATTWAEINVACEACHGPGSDHIAWAGHAPGSEHFSNQGLVLALDERHGVTWQRLPETGNSVRSVPLASDRELGVCAQCHSRRSPFAAGMDHDGRFFDTHEIALLTEGLYFPDGQQHAEVYDVGSFLQSKMHARGVTCSDCHDPHSGGLRAQGNGVCAQCHAPAKYDQPAHTLHAAASAGAQCAACHMPTRNYMVIDARHDHSIRIPRPDLSVTLGVPNACNDCHTNRSAGWAAAAVAHAFGPQRKGFQNFAAALQAADSGAPEAAQGLLELAQNRDAPGIARATAIADLRPYLSAAAVPVLEQATHDADPLVRAAAMDTVLGAPPQVRVQLASALMQDPVPVVRIKAARALAVAQTPSADGSAPGPLDKAFAEYVASQEANADRPEAHMNLALFYAERGEPERSVAQYRSALALDPDFVPAYINLADLYRAGQREADAEAALHAGLAAVPGNADLCYALGLLKIRAKRNDEALHWLQQATLAAPANAHYAYVYGVALHESGQVHQGTAVLEQALVKNPRDTELLSGLEQYARESGNLRGAENYARRLGELGAGGGQ